MPDDAKFDRRRFLKSAAFTAGGIYLVEWCWACTEDKHPKRIAQSSAPKILTTSHRVFLDDEFDTLTAAVDRLLPKDQDPGGVEAGVPEYIDRALTNPDLHRKREDFISGLDALNRECKDKNRVPFVKATHAQQDAMLKDFAIRPKHSGEAHFYRALVSFSMEGFLGDPVYGGNRHRVGWKLVGFDPGPPMPTMPLGDKG